MVDWNEVVRELGPRLLRYFVADCPQPEAADLVQDVLLRLVRRYQEGALDASRGTLVMFAFGIARNVRREARKASKSALVLMRNQEPKDVADETQAPDAIVDNLQQRSLLRTGIAKLSDDEREVILLYMDNDLNLADIGAILGMPLGTVKSHIHRAKENLKQHLIKKKGSHE